MEVCLKPGSDMGIFITPDPQIKVKTEECSDEEMEPLISHQEMSHDYHDSPPNISPPYTSHPNIQVINLDLEPPDISPAFENHTNIKQRSYDPASPNPTPVVKSPSGLDYNPPILTPASKSNSVNFESDDSDCEPPYLSMEVVEESDSSDPPDLTEEYEQRSRSPAIITIDSDDPPCIVSDDDCGPPDITSSFNENSETQHVPPDIVSDQKSDEVNVQPSESLQPELSPPDIVSGQKSDEPPNITLLESSESKHPELYPQSKQAAYETSCVTTSLVETSASQRELVPSDVVLVQDPSSPELIIPETLSQLKEIQQSMESCSSDTTRSCCQAQSVTQEMAQKRRLELNNLAQKAASSLTACVMQLLREQDKAAAQNEEEKEAEVRSESSEEEDVEQDMASNNIECKPCSIILDPTEIDKHFVAEENKYVYSSNPAGENETTGLQKRKNKFVCYHCNKNFKKLYALNKHIKIHDEKIITKCPYCEREFREIKNKELHISNVHFMVKPYNFIKYHKKANEKLNYTCNHCDASFNTEFILSRHLYSEHEIMEDQVKLNLTEDSVVVSDEEKSNQSESEFSDSDDDKEHDNANNSVSYKFKKYCNICKKYYLRHERLIQHMRKMHDIAITRQVKKVKVVDNEPIKDVSTPSTGVETNISQIEVPKVQNKKLNCKFCKFETVKKFEYNMHVLGKHLDFYPYSCNKCNHKCKSKKPLRVHQQNVHNFDGEISFEDQLKAMKELNNILSQIDTYQFSCPACTYYFNNETDLDVHLDKHIKFKRVLYCEYCNYKTSEKRALLSHIKQHFVHKSHRCKICAVYFQKLEDLNQHKIKSHKNDNEILETSETINPYYNINIIGNRVQCLECNRIFGEMRLVKRHMDIHKRTKTRCYCRKCKLSMKTPEELQSHYNEAHPRVQKNTNNPEIFKLKGDFLCYFCKNSFVTKNDVKLHLYQCEILKNSFCQLCEFTTIEFDKMKKHMNSAHNISNWCTSSTICKLCNGHFESPTQLTEHENIIHNEKIKSEYDAPNTSENVANEINGDNINEHPEQLVKDGATVNENCGESANKHPEQLIVDKIINGESKVSEICAENVNEHPEQLVEDEMLTDETLMKEHSGENVNEHSEQLVEVEMLTGETLMKEQSGENVNKHTEQLIEVEMLPGETLMKEQSGENVNKHSEQLVEDEMLTDETLMKEKSGENVNKHSEQLVEDEMLTDETLMKEQSGENVNKHTEPLVKDKIINGQIVNENQILNGHCEEIVDENSDGKVDGQEKRESLDTNINIQTEETSVSKVDNQIEQPAIEFSVLDENVQQNRKSPKTNSNLEIERTGNSKSDNEIENHGICKVDQNDGDCERQITNEGRGVIASNIDELTEAVTQELFDDDDDLMSDSNEQITLHYSNDVVEIKMSTKNYICKLCNCEFTSIEELSNHKNLHPEYEIKVEECTESDDKLETVDENMEIDANTSSENANEVSRIVDNVMSCSVNTRKSSVPCHPVNAPNVDASSSTTESSEVDSATTKVNNKTSSKIDTLFHDDTSSSKTNNNVSSNVDSMTTQDDIALPDVDGDTLSSKVDTTIPPHGTPTSSSQIKNIVPTHESSKISKNKSNVSQVDTEIEIKEEIKTDEENDKEPSNEHDDDDEIEITKVKVSTETQTDFLIETEMILEMEDGTQFEIIQDEVAMEIQNALASENNECIDGDYILLHVARDQLIGDDIHVSDEKETNLEIEENDNNEEENLANENVEEEDEENITNENKESVNEFNTNNIANDNECNGKDKENKENDESIENNDKIESEEVDHLNTSGEEELALRKSSISVSFICKYCDTNFKTPHEVEVHEFKYHVLCLNGHKSIDFKCSQCNKSFKTRDLLQNHMEIIHGKNNNKKYFFCNQCDYSTFVFQFFKMHLKFHSQLFDCSKCNLTFRTINEFDSHQVEKHSNKNTNLKINDETREIDCVYCKKVFPSKTILALHVKHAHSSLRCNCCQYEMSSQENLANHLEIKTRLLECPHCNMECMSECKLNQHLSKDHNTKSLTPSKDTSKVALKTNNNISNNNHVCGNCNIECSDYEDLQFHLEYHHGIHQHSCAICNDKFISKENLHEHQQKEHNVQQLAMGKLITVDGTLSDSDEEKCQCFECKKYFTRKTDLEAHIFAEHNLLCELCPFTTTNTQDFKSHCLTHPELCLYECMDCSLKFCNISDLKSHEKRTHTKATKLVNKHINNVQSKVKNMLKQKSILYLNKNKCIKHKCFACDINFTSRSLYQKHNINMHQNKELKCRHCSFVAKNGNTLKSLASHSKIHTLEYHMKYKKSIHRETDKDQVNENKNLKRKTTFENDENLTKKSKKTYPNENKQLKINKKSTPIEDNNTETKKSIPNQKNLSMVTKMKQVRTKKVREKLQCDHCYKSLISKETMLNHLNNVHKYNCRKIRCAYCEYSTKYISDLKDHCQESHKDSTSIACDICNKHFKNERSVYSHKVIAHRFLKSQIPKVNDKMIIKKSHVAVRKLQWDEEEIKNEETKPEETSFEEEPIENIPETPIEELLETSTETPTEEIPETTIKEMPIKENHEIIKEDLATSSEKNMKKLVHDERVDDSLNVNEDNVFSKLEELVIKSEVENVQVISNVNEDNIFDKLDEFANVSVSEVQMAKSNDIKVENQCDSSSKVQVENNGVVAESDIVKVHRKCNKSRSSEFQGGKMSKKAKLSNCNEINDIQCDQGTTKFKNERFLKIHQTVEHKNNGTQKKLKPKHTLNKFVCEICQNYFITKQKLLLHEKIYHKQNDSKLMHKKYPAASRNNFNQNQINYTAINNKLEIRESVNKKVIENAETENSKSTKMYKNVTTDKSVTHKSTKYFHTGKGTTKNIKNGKTQVPMKREVIEYDNVENLFKIFSKKKKLYKVNNITCKVCTEKFETTKSLKLHENIMHKKKPTKGIKYNITIDKSPNDQKFVYNCHSCSYKTATYSELLEHLRNHKTFVQNEATNNQNTTTLAKITQLDCKKKTTKKNLMCNKCKMIFVDKLLLSEHMLNCFKSKKQKACCPQCIEPPPSITEKHNDPEVLKFKCNICHKIFQDPANLKMHIMSSHSKSVIKLECYQCRKKFINEESLFLHLNTFHDYKNKPYKCSLCTYATLCKTKFANHLLVHTEVRAVSCPSCPLKFKSIKYLKVHHHRIHGNILQNVNKFTCDICHKYFDAKFKIQFHLETTHRFGTKLIHCKSCPYVTTVQFNLMRHIRQAHLKVDRPFVCSICGLRFKLLVILRNHQQIVHLKQVSVVLHDFLKDGIEYDY